MTLRQRLLTNEFTNTLPYKLPSVDREANERFYQRSCEIKEQFRDAALKEARLSNHPNADRIFDHIWERCGSGNLFDMLVELKKFASLALPPIKAGFDFRITEEIATGILNAEFICKSERLRGVPEPVLVAIREHYPVLAETYAPVYEG